MVLYTETQEHKTHVNFQKDTYTKYEPTRQCIYLSNQYNKSFDFQQTFPFIKIKKNIYEAILWSNHVKNNIDSFYDALMNVEIKTKQKINQSKLFINNDDEIKDYIISNHINEDGNSIVFVPEYGIKTIALTGLGCSASLKLRIYTDTDIDDLKTFAICTCRIYPNKLRKKKQKLLYRIHTWNTNIKEKLYIYRGCVHDRAFDIGWFLAFY